MCRNHGIKVDITPGTPIGLLDGSAVNRGFLSVGLASSSWCAFTTSERYYRLEFLP